MYKFMPTEKHWYQRWWGILIISLLSLFLLTGLVFAYFVAKTVGDIRNGVPLTNLDQGSAVGQTKAPASKPPAGQNFRLATDDDPSLGPRTAAVTIVEFSDFECPYCGQAFSTVREIEATYRNQVRLIYRDFPITQVHAHALAAAVAAECAHAQGKFWSYHDKLFTNQSRLDTASLKEYAKQVGLDEAKFNNCLDSGRYESEVEADFQDGLAAGVEGTPTFFINGRKVAGALDVASFKKIIDQTLASLKE